MHLDQSTHPRLLRKPAIGKIPATAEIKVATGQQRRKGSRFVGPTQLDDNQKSRIRAALEKKKIGDEIGREIFIGALEYQISAFAGRLKRLPAPPEPQTQGTNAARDKTLSAIALKASSLSALLRELADGAKARAIKALATQDRLGRGYDERYLCELGGEIDRIERACIAAAASPDPAEPEPDPAPSRELVARLAGVFSECFEMEPTADEDGAFRATLAVLRQVTGLAIGQEPAFL